MDSSPAAGSTPTSLWLVADSSARARTEMSSPVARYARRAQSRGEAFSASVGYARNARPLAEDCSE
jgi:hypothetical protein